MVLYKNPTSRSFKMNLPNFYLMVRLTDICDL